MNFKRNRKKNKTEMALMPIESGNTPAGDEEPAVAVAAGETAAGEIDEVN